MLKVHRCLIALALCVCPFLLAAQTHPPQAPAWAEPGSATHQQVAPPPDFHRPTHNYHGRIGIFQGQSDVGSALVPGSASYNAATGVYTVRSAGYNVWYTRDEFRFLWKKMSGDVSLAANISFPNPGYGDRKAVLIIRQGLDDGSKEALVALHGAGMIQLAHRPEQNLRVKDVEFRIGGRGSFPGGKSPDSLVTVMAHRIGIQKRGDAFTLWVSLEGEPMHQFGPPVHLHLKSAFYVGIGFCSHLPTTVDTGVFSHVVLVNAAGHVH